MSAGPFLWLRRSGGTPRRAECSPAKRSRRIVLSAERKLSYLDSSALVKLVIEEPESPDLERYLDDDRALISSRLARAEVSRACGLANPAYEVGRDVKLLLGSIMLLDVTNELIESARDLTSRSLRTLDALHLASALRTGADELIAYDRRLLSAAAAHGMAAASPG